MSSDYTPVAAHRSTIRLVTDDELQHAAPYNRMVQDVANNLAYHEARAVSGDVDAMRAVTGGQAGDVFTTDDRGSYVLTAGPGGLGSPWDITSIGMPGYFWRSTLWGITDPSTNASGICRFGPMNTVDTDTPNGKLPASMHQNRIILQTRLSCAQQLYEHSTLAGFADVDHSFIVIPGLLPGDVLTGAVGPVWFFNDAPSGEAEATLLARDDITGTPTAPATHNHLYIPSHDMGEWGSQMMPFVHTVSRAGTTQFKIAVKAVTGNAIWLRSFARTPNYLGSVTITRP
jgi:hypothetical protein